MLQNPRVGRWENLFDCLIDGYKITGSAQKVGPVGLAETLLCKGLTLSSHFASALRFE